MPGNRWWCFVVGSCLALVVGCGDGGPKTIPVKGRITFGGGEWPAPGKLYFAPESPDAATGAHVGMADFAKDGSFTASTFKPGDGLTPGTYVVNVECWEKPPLMDIEPIGKSFVPDKFQAGRTSGFKVVVPASGTKLVEVAFDVPKP